MADYKWSEYQDAVFEWTRYGRGHGLVKARAGSGKTTTVVQTQKLISKDQAAIFLAFNKSISEELCSRLPSNVVVKTYHSYGLAAIKREYPNSKVDMYKVDNLIEEFIPRSKRDKLKPVVKELVAFSKNSLALTTRQVMDVALHHNMAMSHTEAFMTNVEDWVMPILKADRERLETVDFDDMCWLPNVLGLKFKKYDFISVDEAQDSNLGNMLLLEKSLKPTGRLLMIGDPAQCQPGDTKVLVNRFDSDGVHPRSRPVETVEVDIKDIQVGDVIIAFARHEKCLIQKARVNEVACRPYKGLMYEVSAAGKRTRCTPSHKWLVRLNKERVFETATCNIVPDSMEILVAPDGLISGENCVPLWHPVGLKSFEYEGDVFSLDVDQHHTYVADGLVTCNSIYGFRGSDSDAVNKLVTRFKAKILPLPISYRCALSIIDEAKKIVPDIEAAPGAPDGEVCTYWYDNFLDDVEPGDMVISRCTAPLVQPCLELLRNGVKATIRGSEIGKSLEKLVRSQNASSLSSMFKSLQEYMEKFVAIHLAAGRHESAQNVVDNVEAIEAFGSGASSVDQLIARIKTTFSDNSEGVSFSTVHRAKGLEANRVWILHPELMPHKAAKPGWEQVQEMNIKYVAVTRAKTSLNFIVDGYPIDNRRIIAKPKIDASAMNSLDLTKSSGLIEPELPLDDENT